ncbi:MAG: hypothetical protein U1F61_20240 [Opitutaceae bacterium]
MGTQDSAHATVPVSFAEYPFEAFARDFDAINETSSVPLDDEPVGAPVAMHAYIQRTYAEPMERTRRGAVMGMCFSFIANHVEHRAFKHHVIRGARGSLFSEPLFRAIYEVVGGFALNVTEEKPSVSAVRRRATRLEPKRPFSLKRLLGLPRFG